MLAGLGITLLACYFVLPAILRRVKSGGDLHLGGLAGELAAKNDDCEASEALVQVLGLIQFLLQARVVEPID